MSNEHNRIHDELVDYMVGRSWEERQRVLDARNDDLIIYLLERIDDLTHQVEDEAEESAELLRRVAESLTATLKTINTGGVK